MTVRPFAAEEGGHVNARIPTDAFSVSSTWADWWENGQKHVAFYGRWNYRNDWIGSGAPDDIAAAATSGFASRCWRNVSTGLTTQSSDGSHTGRAWLEQGAHAESVWGVRDATSGFRLLTDMGFAWIDMKRTQKGCGGTKAGSFFHEHNMDGWGGWSVGVGIWGMSVNYSGSPGERLKRGTPVNYY